MKLNKLIEAQSAGAMKITGDPNRFRAVVGGMELTDGQCVYLAKQFGWNGRTANCGWEMIDKTSKFVSNAKRNITKEAFINNVDLYFESMRRSDTVRITDRIVMVFPNFRLTIIHGGDGLGGSYALFNPDKSISQAEFACSSYKKLFEYIEEHYI